MCMPSFNVFGLFAIIPGTMLLTVSFFVLFAVRKLDSQWLKVFGYVIAVFLWISAALVFSAGLCVITTGRCPMMQMMKQGGMCPMMPQEKQNPIMQHQMMGR